VYLPPPVDLAIEVPFLVDTGASWTTLHGLDMMKFGPNMKELPVRAAPLQMFGVGGAVQTWTITAGIVFSHDDGATTAIGLNIALSWDEHRMLPSLLGRDVLNFGTTTLYGPSEEIKLDLPTRVDLVAKAPWE
jgi:hypothetical protein